MYTPRFTCPHCLNEQIPILNNSDGVLVGSVMLCGCEESYKAEEQKHRMVMEARKQKRSQDRRRLR